MKRTVLSLLLMILFLAGCSTTDPSQDTASLSYDTGADPDAWDANRQALQDKMVGTVVIRTGKPPAAAADVEAAIAGREEAS